MKERYYGIIEKLDLLHPDPSKVGSKPFHYDCDHERRRKEQLERLYARSSEEVEEEEMLRSELKKVTFNSYCINYSTKHVQININAQLFFR